VAMLVNRSVVLGAEVGPKRLGPTLLHVQPDGHADHYEQGDGEHDHHRIVHSCLLERAAGPADAHRRCESPPTLSGRFDCTATPMTRTMPAPACASRTSESRYCLPSLRAFIASGVPPRQAGTQQRASHRADNAWPKANDRSRVA